MRLRAVPVTVLAGLIALGMAGCSPEDDVPTASPTVASPTPTEVATTPSPTATLSPTPTLTEEEVHVAEATETLKQFIQVGSDIANAGGVGGEEIDQFLGTPELQDEYARTWASLISSGTHTVGTPSISDVTVKTYGSTDAAPALELRYCVDNSAVRQLDGSGVDIPRPDGPMAVVVTTLQRFPDASWKVIAHYQVDETC